MSTFNIFHQEANLRHYQQGEVIFEQGSDADFMFDVVKGKVSLQRNGREIVALTDGEIFGETALINAEPHSVTAIAVVDTEVAKISQRQFTFMITETPNFALKVMRTLAERLSKETAKHSS